MSVKFYVPAKPYECPIKNEFSFDVSNALPKFNDYPFQQQRVRRCNYFRQNVLLFSFY